MFRQPWNRFDWLTTGITYLLPQTEDTKNPKNYRPITAFLQPRRYFFKTSVITERVFNITLTLFTPLRPHPENKMGNSVDSESQSPFNFMEGKICTRSRGREGMSIVETPVEDASFVTNDFC